eukprot:8269355-Pyramimonas_sp.AAC.1
MPNAILNPKPPEVEREMRNVTWFVRAKGQASPRKESLFRQADTTFEARSLATTPTNYVVGVSTGDDAVRRTKFEQCCDYSDLPLD